MIASNPKVSVIVTVYNLAFFISEALDSVLTQDYDNFEVVVADDASTDGSQEIIKEYLIKYPNKIKLILNESNQGVTANSNTAFFACSGELIAILDGDDIYLPGKIKAQVEKFVQDPEVVLCYHATEIFDSATNKTIYVTNQNPREYTDSAEEIIARGGILTCAVMVRRSACPPGGFDTRLRDTQDWVFLTEVALKGKVARIDRVLCRYRKHGRGASDRTFELLDQSLRALDIIIENHPERRDFVEICRQGKARYIAGEAFRQLNKNLTLARDLAKQAVELDPTNIRYRIFLFLTQFKPLARISIPLISRMKYIIKRFFL
ncbi:glycosyltransferase [Kamptonema formosum]|uniref:glycosyltransferase n=1 Tax=Kamptonema formosum TaxID=331992 RepID=UPI000348101F|nr:glycosyltransferase [Oscillatoria sp. PCC 10802]